MVAGQAALDAQQASVKDTVISTSTSRATPSCWPVAAPCMSSETPADLTRQMEYADNVVEGHETRAFDDLHAAEVAARGP